MRGFKFIILLTMLSSCIALAENKSQERIKWLSAQGRPLINTSELARIFSFRAFFDPKKRRLLLEHGKKRAFFLPYASFAVIDDRFIRLGHPMVQIDRSFYLDAAVVKSQLIHFIPESRRAWLSSEINRVFKKVNLPLCATERPVRKIFLDPGHGGADQGAMSGTVAEKNIVLKFANLMAKELTQMGFQVLFSRRGDVTVPLELRPAMAKEWGADVFISIHANSSEHSSVRGTETYILSSQATDARARKLALIENYQFKELESKQNSNRRTKDLEQILWDIQQTSYLQDSAYLASHVQNSIEAAIREKNITIPRRHYRTVRQAPFLVLSRSPMPAILLELAYLSNVNDRNLLKSKKFQQTLAKALAKGVNVYAKRCAMGAPKSIQGL